MESSQLLLMRGSSYVGEPQLNQQRLVCYQRIQSLSMMHSVTLADMCGLDNLEETDNTDICQLVKVLAVSVQVLGGILNKFFIILRKHKTPCFYYLYMVEARCLFLVLTHKITHSSFDIFHLIGNYNSINVALIKQKSNSFYLFIYGNIYVSN